MTHKEVYKLKHYLLQKFFCNNLTKIYYLRKLI